MTVTIDILPTELRAHIVGYVAPDEDTPHIPRNLKDLHALCLASKALNEVATPILYRAFSTEETADHLGLLLRSISENSQLAKHIKYIVIHHWYFHSRDVALSSESIAALQAAAPLLVNVLRTEAMSSALEHGSFEARLVLLLAVATQVNSLGILAMLPKSAPLDPIDLRMKERDEAGLLVLDFMRLLASTAKDQSTSKPLSKLAYVQIDRWFNDDDYTDTSVAQALLALPQLRTCSMSGLITRANSQDLHYAGQTSKITRLHLAKCDISNSSLAALLCSCIALEDVCIRWVGCGSDESQMTYLDQWKVDVDFVELAQALAGHAKTLKVLVLDTLSTGIAFVEKSASFGSFQHFGRLENLEIDDSVLYGETLGSLGEELLSLDRLEKALENFFPPNIKELTLHNRKDWNIFAPMLCILNKLLPKTIERISASFIVSESLESKDRRTFLSAVKQGFFPYMRIEDHPKFAHEVLVYECDTVTSKSLAARVSSALADPESFLEDEVTVQLKERFREQFGEVSEDDSGGDSEESENEPIDEQQDEPEVEV